MIKPSERYYMHSCVHVTFPSAGQSTFVCLCAFVLLSASYFTFVCIGPMCEPKCGAEITGSMRTDKSRPVRMEYPICKSAKSST